jgi:hypothetical protein
MLRPPCPLPPCHTLPAGDGVPVNPAIAHRLLLLLAELGNAEAQADAAFHLALGVEPVAPNSRDQVFRWGLPRGVSELGVWAGVLAAAPAAESEHASTAGLLPAM